MNNKAFTLLEMIAVVIILALAATVSVSSYSKYRIRTKVNSMFSASSAAQLAVVNDYFGQGYSSFTGISYAAGSQPFVISPSNFISTIAIVNGVITITGNSTNLGGRAINMTLTPSVSNNEIRWTCSVSSTYWEFAPKECQN